MVEAAGDYQVVAVAVAVAVVALQYSIKVEMASRRVDIASYP